MGGSSICGKLRINSVIIDRRLYSYVTNIVGKYLLSEHYRSFLNTKIVFFVTSIDYDDCNVKNKRPAKQAPTRRRAESTILLCILLYLRHT